MDINHIILSGTLVNDPVIRYNPRGDEVISFTMAFEQPLKGKKGTQAELSYMDVIALGSTIRNNHNILRMGEKVIVNGRIKQRKWKTPEGITHSKLEVIAERIHFLRRDLGGEFEPNT